MDKKTEALKLALEVLEQLQGGCTDHNDGTVEAITVWCPEVIDAILEALAEQPAQRDDWKDRLIAQHEETILWQAKRIAELMEQPAQQEPLFWYRPCSNGMYEGPIHDAQIESVRKESGAWRPLYTSPPAPMQQRWPSDCLVSEKAKQSGFDLSPTPNMLYTVRGNHAQLVNFARAMLATAPQPAQQEPVAYIRKDQLQKAAQSPMLCEVTPEPRQDRIGIHTSPPASKPWVGLSDEEVHELWMAGDAGIGEKYYRVVAYEVGTKLREKNA